MSTSFGGDLSVLGDKLVESATAFDLIASRQHIVAGMAAAEPVNFFNNIGDICQAKEGVTLHCANPTQDYSCFTQDNLQGRLQTNVMFLTSKVRHLQGREIVHYVPQHLSQWVRHLLLRGEVDIFWGSCTPPDSRGFVSLGPGCCYESEILKAAKTVVLEVNPNMPVTYGATHVPVQWVDYFVRSDHPLPTIDRASVNDADRKIAQFVAELVADGSTIQLGIGSIPNAIGDALKAKKDLGVHTEMINDTMMDLYQAGVVTGRHKSIFPGKMVGAFAYGTRELYDFIDRNPAVEMQPASVTNDPFRISRNTKMVSVNTAVEIDITGQVCSESVGHRELSGVGGAAETHIGAQWGKGGRGIIAVRSTAQTKQGPKSKITFELAPGAKVSISRNDVDTVVTEYGVAELMGRSVAERVKALVGIADPQFRDELLHKARQACYL